MVRRFVFPVVLLLLFLLQIPAFAAGTFISAASRVDVVHDAARDTLYISGAGQVLRYRLGTGTFDAPFSLGGNLKGMDLSPDGETLAVADQTRTATEVWVWLIDLPTGTAQKVTFPRAFGEGGTFSPAFADDGALLLSGTYEGSGWVPLRRYDPATGNTTILPVPPFNDIRQNSMLAASGDASVVGWEESNISDGAFGRYRVSDGNLLKKSGSDGTGWFNYEIGVNANGTQYALPTFGGCFITDGNLVKQRTIGVSGGAQPIGVVFHPVEPRVYFAWSTTTQVREFETAGYTQVGSYDAGYTFTHPGNASFQWGRLKMSRDGSLLFVTVGGGVRYFNLYAPLAAESASLVAVEDTALAVTLSGSVGNGGAISYAVTAEPEHGILSGDAPNLVYTPDPDYFGPDSFTFVAAYGRARANGTVSIDVAPVNDPPVADFQSVGTDEDAAVSIHLTGTDAEGDALTFALVAAPVNGTLSGTGPDLVYTPDPNFFGTDALSFTVNDGTATSAPRTISITVASVNDPPVAHAGTLSTDEDAPAGIVLSGSDLEGAALTYTIIAAPAHGTLSGTAPNLTYTPAANYFGADAFSFTVNDGKATSAAATVSIAVASVNDPPIASSGSLSINEDTAASVVLSGSDVEGSGVSYSILTSPAHGTLSGSGATRVYAPAANYHGADSFTFRVNDGQADSAPATVSISIAAVNDAPIAVADLGTTKKNTSVVLNLVANDTDVDGDTLTISSAESATPGASVTVLAGAVTVRYTPPIGFTGTNSFSYRLIDGQGGSAVGTVTVTVTKK